MTNSVPEVFVLKIYLNFNRNCQFTKSFVFLDKILKTSFAPLKENKNVNCVSDYCGFNVLLVDAVSDL